MEEIINHRFHQAGLKWKVFIIANFIIANFTKAKLGNI